MKLGRNARLRIRFIVDTFLKNQTTVQKTKKIQFVAVINSLISSLDLELNALKGVSSRRYGQAGYKKPHKEALWSPSYFAVSVGGAPLDILHEYIRNQEKPS
jgi:hypothetical protein